MIDKTDYGNKTEVTKSIRKTEQETKWKKYHTHTHTLQEPHQMWGWEGVGEIK